MIVLLGFFWYWLGFVICIHTLFSIDQKLTVRDLIASLIGGFLGPFTFVWYLAYAKKTWLDKHIL